MCFNQTYRCTNASHRAAVELALVTHAVIEAAAYTSLIIAIVSRLQRQATRIPRPRARKLFRGAIGGHDGDSRVVAKTRGSAQVSSPGQRPRGGMRACNGRFRYVRVALCEPRYRAKAGNPLPPTSNRVPPSALSRRAALTQGPVQESWLGCAAPGGSAAASWPSS